MLNITRLALRLERETEWQKTPEELDDRDYVEMVINGLRRMLIDTGRAETYDSALLTSDGTTGEVFYDITCGIDEEDYIMIVAQIGFYKRVANDVNNIVGYTTDALTVTNADKPYANIKDTLANLENDRRILHYKMCRYAMLD